jgi:Cysteine-rich CPCC
MSGADAHKVEPGSEHACPVCRETIFSEEGSYEICDTCGWEDDPVQGGDPDVAGGANDQSLNQARTAWAARKSAA